MRSSGKHTYRYIHTLTWPRGRRHRQRFYWLRASLWNSHSVSPMLPHVPLAGRERESSFCLSAPSVSCVLPIHATDPVEFIAHTCMHHVLHLESSHHAHTDTHIHAQALAHSCTHTRAHTHTHWHTHTCITYTRVAHLDTTYTVRE